MQTASRHLLIPTSLQLGIKRDGRCDRPLVYHGRGAGQHDHPAGNGQFLRGEKSSGGNGLFLLAGYRGGQPYYRLAPRVMTRWFPGGNESICSPTSLSNKEPGLSREKQERKGPSCATCLETAERLRMIY